METDQIPLTKNEQKLIDAIRETRFGITSISAILSLTFKEWAEKMKPSNPEVAKEHEINAALFSGWN